MLRRRLLGSTACVITCELAEWPIHHRIAFNDVTFNDDFPSAGMGKPVTGPLMTGTRWPAMAPTQVSSSTPIGRAAPPMRKMRGWPPKPTAIGQGCFHDAAARSLPTKIVHQYLADQEVCEPDGVDGQITSAKPSVHQPRIARPAQGSRQW